MLKKTILFFILNIFLISIHSKGNILFTNCSRHKINISVYFGKLYEDTDSYEFCRSGSNRLAKQETLVINFMEDSLHSLFYKKIAFKIKNRFYTWGPFYLNNFNLNYDYKIYTNEEFLWFLGHNFDGVFIIYSFKRV